MLYPLNSDYINNITHTLGGGGGGGGGVGMVQWSERSPPTNVSRIRFPDPASHVGWVCCWFSFLFQDTIVDTTIQSFAGTHSLEAKTNSTGFGVVLSFSCADLQTFLTWRNGDYTGVPKQRTFHLWEMNLFLCKFSYSLGTATWPWRRFIA